MAKRKTIFDDKPIEISVRTSSSFSFSASLLTTRREVAQELTFIIKRNIASLNQQIAHLQTHVRPTNGSRQAARVDEHNNNVVKMLQGRLATTSLGFKDVLEIRTQNMKASRDRTEQFGLLASSGPPSGARDTDYLSHSYRKG